MDILSSLPCNDVLFPCIFSRLSLNDLFKLRGVSKSYLHLVDDYFARCTELDLSKTKNGGDAEAFKLMTYGNTILQRLCLSGATHWLTDELLLPVIKSCSMLTSIDLTACSQLTNDVLCCIAASLGHLTFVSLSGCHWVDKENFKLMVASNPKLSSVNISSCWSLDDDCIRFCAFSCPELTSIYLTNIYSVTNASLLDIASSCPLLTTLAVNGCWRITNDGIRAIGEYCRKLCSLAVSDCRDVTEASLARLRVRGVDIDVAATSVHTLQRLSNTFQYARPYINLQI